MIVNYIKMLFYYDNLYRAQAEKYRKSAVRDGWFEEVSCL